MDAARWQRVEALCGALLELPPDQRGALLDQECAADPELKREVLSLLDHAGEDADDSAISGVATQVALPHQIGPYRIGRRLGQGGMGDVYLATRTAADITQTVALKVIRRGMDTEEVLRRFQLERRILAALHHPNIATLLDAGATEDGRPYFAMEFVEGAPITDYCAARSLDTMARLDLFRQVCIAVHHAHQNLIVHRDLKPKNILVTAAGVPKLLDFGIGKVLAPSDSLGPAVETRTAVRMLTPEYAAPEQVSGGPITTATDIYALGLLLYELVTGSHPYLRGGESLVQIEQAVLTGDPERPSTRAARTGERRLKGDLDTIILKALRKEPDRRYLSAAAFAEDLERWREGRPVAARPDTLGYRVGKFVRRNAALVTGAAAIAVALVATAGVTLVQSRRVAAEAARVAQERDKALEVRGFLMEMFGASGADKAVGDTITAARLLDLQAQRIDTAYRDRPALAAEMLEVLADGYDRLGLYARAMPLAQRALAIREALPPDSAAVALSLNQVGWLHHELGHSAEALPFIERAAAMHHRRGASAETDLSRSLNDQGVILDALGKHQDAESVLVEALALRRAAYGDGHRAVGITANNLAAAYYFQKELDQAVPTQALAVEALRQSVGPDHQRTIVALGNLAAFKMAAGNLAEAEADYRELLAKQTRLQGEGHPVTEGVRTSLAAALANRGNKERNDRLLAESEALYRTALANLEHALGPDHPRVGTILDRLAGVIAARGRAQEALPLAERGTAVLLKALGPENPSTKSARDRLASIRRTIDSSRVIESRR